jgi:hypothetical protein
MPAGSPRKTTKNHKNTETQGPCPDLRGTCIKALTVFVRRSLVDPKIVRDRPENSFPDLGDRFRAPGRGLEGVRGGPRNLFALSKNIFIFVYDGFKITPSNGFFLIEHGLCKWCWSEAFRSGARKLAQGSRKDPRKQKQRSHVR